MCASTDRIAGSRIDRAASASNSRPAITEFGQHGRALVVLIIAVVVVAVLPDLVQYLNVKHAPITVHHLSPQVPLAKAVTYTAAVALFLLCAIIVLQRGRLDRKVSGALVLLLGLVIPYIISPTLPETTRIVWIALAAAVIFAIWSIEAPVDGLKWVTISGSIFGAYSIICGLIIPEYTNFDADSTKALIANWQLAGPFVHSNSLGVYCALALALSPLIVSVRWRILNGSILLAAIVASASRTALVAVGILALWWIICRFRILISVRFAGTVLVGCSAATVLVLPLLSWNRIAFTGRGQIWTASLSEWEESRWVGLGIDWFRVTETPGPYFSRWALMGTGHNLVVDTLVRSGLVGVCLLALVLLAAIRSTRRLDILRHQVACFGYLIAFLVISCTEATWVLLPNIQLFPVAGLVFAVVIEHGTAVTQDVVSTLPSQDVKAGDHPKVVGKLHRTRVQTKRSVTTTLEAGYTVPNSG
jgi:O-antigen ligase